ncbi:hypothetical protein MVEN_00250500 [Mycena venus]|uniref:Uncharacterized protein n=1 Tax=Mycena venus TaxID=2733690 RepID=A0A8H6YY61_9AGAR|nr:hypothetical protein MVEN_00250500 [Mycena venus]
MILPALVLLALSDVQLVLACLYPTYPVANTVLRPGDRAYFKWTDTRRHPYLSELGPLSIELCNTDGTPIATLANEVPPVARAHSVQIPKDLALPATADSTSRDFVVLFKSSEPISTAWTADFCIIPHSNIITDSTLSYSKPDDANATVTNRLLTLVLPTTTIVSELGPAATIVPAATTISAGPLSDGGGAGTGLNRVHQPSSANPRKWSAGFRLLFIAWPAFIGISMAL